MSENKNKTIALENLKEILKEVNTIKELKEKANIIINEDNGLKYINVISEGKEEKYYLVDNKEYINNKIENKDFNFKNHIFFVEINFKYSYFSIDNNVLESNNIYTKYITFKEKYKKKALYKNFLFKYKIVFLEHKKIYLENKDLLGYIEYLKENPYDNVYYTNKYFLNKTKDFLNKNKDFLDLIKYKIKSFSLGYKSFLEKTSFSFEKSIFKNNVIFFKCNFNMDVNFENTTFFKTAEFFGSYFKEGINFNFSYFELSIFKFVIFLGYVKFNNCIFNKLAIFSNSNFYKGVEFTGSKFIDFFYAPSVYFAGDVLLNICTFEGNVYFNDSCLNGNIHFNNSLSKNNLYLQKLIIQGGILSFEEFIYKESFFLSLLNYNLNNKYYKKFILNLKGLTGSSNNLFFDENIINCLDKNTPRETYNILKNALLARKDTINALRYYKKEYDKHLKDTSFGVDKIILLFTKYVSYFSTAPLRAILWWIGTLLVFGIWILLAYNDMLTPIYINLSIIILFFILIYPYRYKLVKYVIWGIFVLGIIEFIYYYNINIDDIKMFYSIFLDKIAEGWEYITKPENRELMRYAFNPLASITSGKEIFCISKNGGNCEEYIDGKIEFTIRLLTFIKTILLGIITYEIVKSVRKFSRRF